MAEHRLSTPLFVPLVSSLSCDCGGQHRLGVAYQIHGSPQRKTLQIFMPWRKIVTFILITFCQVDDDSLLLLLSSSPSPNP